MIFEHQRFEIWSQVQHPMKHTLADFLYTNPALPGVVNVEGALNWVMAVLYPNAKAAVANQAALPLVGNTINDYRVVLDDGDGKSAAYRWEQREGEVSPSWHKVMDMDWSTDSILANFLQVTQDLYVVRNGRQDLDGLGAVITGTFAGQTIYGGTQPNQNLTLRANSGDGVGPSTGYVQVDDHFRPAINNFWDAGTATEKFRHGYFAQNLYVGNLTLSSGSIVDSSGAISFDNENLTTTGNITGAVVTGTSSVVANTMTMATGSITDTTGSISFGNENLSTTGTLASGVLTVSSDIVVGVGSITSVSGQINFDNENLLTTGTFQSGDAVVTRLDSDNIRLDGNTISILNLNGNLILQANGTGVVDVQNPLTTLGITATGTVTVTGQLNADNLRLDGNVLSSTNLNGDITFTPNGTGKVITSSHLIPAADTTLNLGDVALRFDRIYLSGGISDGTDDIEMVNLLTLRHINVGVATGMTLFWNGVKWVPSYPDTEVDHGTITGLLDDDHTQYAMLAGRATGQALSGGTGAGENLTLRSTAHATKGAIYVDSHFQPETNASYSGGWQGTDLGSSGKFFRDLYMKGEAKNFRLENFTFAGLPGFNSQNIGRLMYATDTKKAYVDTGTAIKAVSYSKYLSDTTWDGIQTTQDFNVSADIEDARKAMWAIHDNTNDFDRIYCSIKAISATTVRVTVSPALPAGSYRLIGIE